MSMTALQKVEAFQEFQLINLHFITHELANFISFLAKSGITAA